MQKILSHYILTNFIDIKNIKNLIKCSRKRNVSGQFPIISVKLINLTFLATVISRLTCNHCQLLQKLSVP